MLNWRHGRSDVWVTQNFKLMWTFHRKLLYLKGPFPSSGMTIHAQLAHLLLRSYATWASLKAFRHFS